MVSEGFGSLGGEKKCLSKVPETGTWKPATSREKEHSKAGSSADTYLHQPAAATTQHSNIKQHTRSSTSTKTKSCHNKELSKHIHSVLL